MLLAEEHEAERSKANEHHLHPASLAAGTQTHSCRFVGTGERVITCQKPRQLSGLEVQVVKTTTEVCLARRFIIGWRLHSSANHVFFT